MGPSPNWSCYQYLQKYSVNIYFMVLHLWYIDQGPKHPISIQWTTTFHLPYQTTTPWGQKCFSYLLNSPLLLYHAVSSGLAWFVWIWQVILFTCCMYFHSPCGHQNIVALNSIFHLESCIMQEPQATVIKEELSPSGMHPACGTGTVGI